MKSRLEPAPLTVEDESVLAFISWHLYDGIKYRMDVYRDTDRRDADLMNWAQTIRRVRADGCRMLKPLNDRVSSADPNPIDYGGDITRFV